MATESNQELALYSKGMRWLSIGLICLPLLGWGIAYASVMSQRPSAFAEKLERERYRRDLNPGIRSSRGLDQENEESLVTSLLGPVLGVTLIGCVLGWRTGLFRFKWTAPAWKGPEKKSVPVLVDDNLVPQHETKRVDRSALAKTLAMSLVALGVVLLVGGYLFLDSLYANARSAKNRDAMLDDASTTTVVRPPGWRGERTGVTITSSRSNTTTEQQQAQNYLQSNLDLAFGIIGSGGVLVIVGGVLWIWRRSKGSPNAIPASTPE